MNRSIRALWMLTTLMFFALMANASISYMVRTPDLLADSRNVRVRDEQFGSPRGPILVGNTPVAESVETGTRPYAYQRSYLDGPLYAPITGYYSYIYGRSGLEDRYNAELIGQADSQFTGRLYDAVTGRPTQGGQVQTTIQPKLQHAAWDALGGRKGAVIVTDYTTGAILAWVTTPSYDPSALASLDFPATETAWQELNDDPARPMADRATQEIYPPGSTFKLVVAAAALENGYKDSTLIDTPASLQLPGTNTMLPNQSNCGNDQRTLDDALTLSCNTSFANLGMALGADTVRAQAEAFGFNSEIGGDTRAATSVFPSELDKAQLAMSSIGQFEVAASVVQMNTVAATIANGGVMMRPYAVHEVRDANQKVVWSAKPTQVGTPITTTTASTLQQMMRHVVERGTGTAAQAGGMPIAGKTGTAETTSDVESYSWFTGFSTQGTVAVTVFLEEPGGGTAAEAAGQIFGGMQ